ncbi:MAG: hypothetical protein JW947_11030 [Sedimentisphaerales bacterium]|nr:hypothetical protein [Sedimentisphaerales bacterium]
MASFDSKNRSLRDEFGRNERPLDSAVKPNEDLFAEQDLIMEQILENINNTPIGQVLKKIASLPEVRKEKVLDVRQQLIKGNYRLSERLDIVLDKVLEDLTM